MKEVDNMRFYEKYDNDDILDLVNCLDNVLNKDDFGECVTYTDDGIVTVDAGLTSFCLFADNKTIQNRFMRMLKDARSFGVDPQALYGV